MDNGRPPPPTAGVLRSRRVEEVLAGRKVLCVRELEAAVDIAYEITAEDLVAFNLYHWRHSPATRRHIGRAQLVYPTVWLAAGLFAGWVFRYRPSNDPEITRLASLALMLAWPLIALGAGVWWFFWYPRYYRAKVVQVTRRALAEGKNRASTGLFSLTVSPEGVVEKSDYGQRSYRWEAVERVESTDDHAFLYTAACEAIVIPRRAFLDRPAFERFTRAARGYLDTYRRQREDDRPGGQG
jgi:hypothetical protein